MPRSRMPEHDKPLYLNRKEVQCLLNALKGYKDKEWNQAVKLLSARLVEIMGRFRDSAAQWEEARAQTNANSHWVEDKGAPKGKTVAIAAPTASQVKRILSKRAKKKARKRGCRGM